MKSLVTRSYANDPYRGAGGCIASLMPRHKAHQYWEGVTSLGDEKSVTSMSPATPNRRVFDRSARSGKPNGDDRRLSYAKYFDSALVWSYGEGHC
jgi:hypothetical protein